MRDLPPLVNIEVRGESTGRQTTEKAKRAPPLSAAGLRADSRPPVGTRIHLARPQDLTEADTDGLHRGTRSGSFRSCGPLSGTARRPPPCSPASAP